MPRRNQISQEEVAEIKKARRKNRDKAMDRRLEALLLHAEGKSREEIAAKTGYGKQYVTELVGSYARGGLENYVRRHYKGNNRNMSLADEEKLLEPFRKQAEEGRIITTGEILAAYEAKLGRPAGSNSQIYYVLARHGWRKVMPRSKHPGKASDEVVEASKKLNPSTRAQWKYIPDMV